MTLFLSSIGVVCLRAQDLPVLEGSANDIAQMDHSSLLDAPSLPDASLPEDPENPFGLVLPASAAEPPAILDAPESTSPAVVAAREREQYLAGFAVDNALTRSALQNRRSTGARFFDGFGGIPNPTNSPLIPKTRPGEYRLRLGPIRMTPSLGASYSKSFGSSDSGLASFGGGGRSFRGSSGENAGTGSVNAGVSAEIGEPALGRFLTLDYGIGFNFGSRDGANDKPDQTLTLMGVLEFVRFKFGLGISFDSLSGTDREFGRDVQRDFATISFTSTYVHSPKTSLDLNLSVPISQYEGGIDSTGFYAGVTANYHLSSKTSFGLGFTTGLTSLSGESSVSGRPRSDSQTSQRIDLRMSSIASPFITYTGSVGYEWRDEGDAQSTSPVFALGVTYAPRVGTSFSLTIDQQIQNSAAIADSNFTTTSVTLSASQRLGSFASLGASLGYEYASYESTDSEESVDRRDKTFFAQLSLSRTFFQRLSLTGSVSYYHTDSNDLPQESTQISVSASYMF